MRQCGVNNKLSLTLRDFLISIFETVSPGDAWFGGSAVYSTMGSYWSNWCVQKGGRSLCAKISHEKGQSLYPPFWRGQSTQPLSRQTRQWTRPYHSALCQ